MKLNSIGTNQNEVTLNNGATVFFSYQTPVAACVKGQYYYTEQKWSNTTTRHINNWLGSNKFLAKTKPQAWFDALTK